MLILSSLLQCLNHQKLRRMAPSAQCTPCKTTSFHYCPLLSPLQEQLGGSGKFCCLFSYVVFQWHVFGSKMEDSWIDLCLPAPPLLFLNNYQLLRTGFPGNLTSCTTSQASRECFQASLEQVKKRKEARDYARIELWITSCSIIRLLKYLEGLSTEEAQGPEK